ncbi:MAG: TolC family protein [Planctomycetota bacterium]|nr:TolC family protein [Planctomycetota bacterium]
MNLLLNSPCGEARHSFAWRCVAHAALLMGVSTGCMTTPTQSPEMLESSPRRASLRVAPFNRSAERAGAPSGKAPQAVAARSHSPKPAKPANSRSNGVILAGAEEPADPAPAARSPRKSDRPRGEEFLNRIQLPPDLPGAESPPAALPSIDDPEARALAIENLFPPLEKVPERAPAAGSSGIRYSLRELEERTLSLAPGVDQALNAISAADGLVWQVGRAPNPLVGYEADTVRTAGTAGYHGVFFEQMIKTGGKLSLAQQSASYDVANAHLDLQKAQADQLNSVRKAWYQMLVARENVRITRVLAEFSESIFRLPVDQLREEQIAPYEPLPLRALAVQARAAYDSAIARERAAWQQLAAAVGDPDLPEGELEGSAVVELESLDYKSLTDWMQQSHTDLQSASNRSYQSRVDVEQQYRQRIPDVKVYSAIQHDYTTPPTGRTTWNLQVGIPVPIFDLNRGNIQKAEAESARAAREYERVRNDLRQKLAEAWQRYESARIQVQAYRSKILPDQARAYLGFARRHAEEGSVSYTDVVVAQQNLATALNIYVTSLSDQWNAWSDLLQLLQIQDLSQLPVAGAGAVNMPPAPAASPTVVPPSPLNSPR